MSKPDIAGTKPIRVDLEAGETAWLFSPDSPWRDEAYTLRVDPRLEDVAGNSVAGSFEEPKRTAQSNSDFVSIAFRPEPGAFER